MDDLTKQLLEKEQKRMERQANRRGGPADTIMIDVTCPGCGGLTKFSLRQVTRSIKNRKCEHCRTQIPEEVLKTRLRAVMVETAQSALAILKDCYKAS